ncbi:MAG: hypothetical protein M0Z45_07010 [Actinomycetota bacterium]|nr:hypothetical protein [Actinomycetota bacterium]
MPFRSVRLDTSIAGPSHLSLANIDDYLVEDEELSIYLYEVSTRSLKVPVRLRMVAVAQMGDFAEARITLLAVDFDVATLPSASAIGPISRLGDARGQLHRLFVVPSPSVVRQVITTLGDSPAWEISSLEVGGPSNYQIYLVVSTQDTTDLSLIDFSENRDLKSSQPLTNPSDIEQILTLESKLLFHPLSTGTLDLGGKLNDDEVAN